MFPLILSRKEYPVMSYFTFNIFSETESRTVDVYETFMISTLTIIIVDIILPFCPIETEVSGTRKGRRGLLCEGVEMSKRYFDTVKMTFTSVYLHPYTPPPAPLLRNDTRESKCREGFDKSFLTEKNPYRPSVEDNFTEWSSDLVGLAGPRNGSNRCYVFTKTFTLFRYYLSRLLPFCFNWFISIFIEDF